MFVEADAHVMIAGHLVTLEGAYATDSRAFVYWSPDHPGETGDTLTGAITTAQGVPLADTTLTLGTHRRKYKGAGMTWYVKAQIAGRSYYGESFGPGCAITLTANRTKER